MMRLFHGTTEEHGRSILENGFGHDSTVWTCSDSKMMYFYELNSVRNTYGSTIEAARELCIQMALKSAFFTAALTDSQSRNLFVFELEVFDSARRFVQPDQSIGYWDGMSVCVPADALGRFPCTVLASPDAYSPRLSALCLSALREKTYLVNPNVTELERDVIARLDNRASAVLLNALDDFFIQPDLVDLHHNIYIKQKPKANRSDRVEETTGSTLRHGKASLRGQLRKAAQDVDQRTPQERQSQHQADTQEL